jgi:hypothetical protein
VFHQSPTGTQITVTSRLERTGRTSNAIGCATPPLMLLGFVVYRLETDDPTLVRLIVGIFVFVAVALIVFRLADRISMRAVQRTLSPDPFPDLMYEVFGAVELHMQTPPLDRELRL